jgi:type I restriction enzyme, R subunit
MIKSNTHFKDELHKKEMVEFGPQHEAVSISRYKEMSGIVKELIELREIIG